MGRVFLLLVALTSTGCAVARVKGPLPSDPIVDPRSVRFLNLVERPYLGPSDEQIAQAIQLTLKGQLAALDRWCEESDELFRTAAALGTLYPTQADWRAQKALCSPKEAVNQLAVASGPSNPVR